jgi:hypothetical protein
VQDRPTADELLEALAEFLDAEVVPAFEGRKRFHAIVAANVARITAREFRLGPAQREAELAELGDLLGEKALPAGSESADAVNERRTALHAELCRRIERGDADAGELRKRALAFLRRATERKLAIDDPKSLSRRSCRRPAGVRSRPSTTPGIPFAPGSCGRS